ncbi:MAG: hypothetical protein IKV25_03835 [Clostridia bacterium]|nr:hypothetical protein [Clostridia bacterium]
MKKFLISIILIGCVVAVACVAFPKLEGFSSEQSGDIPANSIFDKIFSQMSSDSTEEPIDIFSEPQIVLDKSSEVLEKLRDDEGNHIGYYRITEGTNCGVMGTMLIEFLDLDKNVIDSYQPKLAGQGLGYNLGEGYILEIWESDAIFGQENQNYNSNSYYFRRGGNSTPYAYIEDRNGATVRLDLYNENGDVVTSLTPNDPKNRLSVWDYTFTYGKGYSIKVYEYVDYKFYGGIMWGTESREMYYNSNGKLLCEIEYDYTENNEKSNLIKTRARVKNASGKLLRTYERSNLDKALASKLGEAPDFYIYYDLEFDCLSFYADDGLDYMNLTYCINHEYIDLSENKVLLKLEKTYQDGNKFITEYTHRGGKLIATAGGKSSYYSKIEIYDKKGNLKEIVEAANGELLKVEWSAFGDTGYISFYDTEGNSMDYYEVNGETYSRTVYFG